MFEPPSQLLSFLPVREFFAHFAESFGPENVGCAAFVNEGKREEEKEVHGNEAITVSQIPKFLFFVSRIINKWDKKYIIINAASSL